MTVVATIREVPIHAAMRRGADHLFGEAEATISGRNGHIYLTMRGLYLEVDGQSFGIDLNALARAMGDAVGRRHGDGGQA
jgi:hypothetical protein